MKLLILPSARDDLAEGFAFYERQAEGLGEYFLDGLFSDIESLRVYAGIHRQILGHCRLLSRRFPFAVYYTWHAGVASIVAVLDCRRDPAWIRGQLNSR